MKRNLSIKSNLAILLVAFTVISLSVFLVSSYFGVSEVINTFSEKRFRDFTNLFVSSVEPDLLMGRESNVFQKCTTLSQNDEVVFISIRTKTNDIICDIKKEEGSLNLAVPVFFDIGKKDLLATVKIGFRDNSFSKLRNRILGYAAAIMFAILALSVVIASKLVKPYVSVFERIGLKLSEKNLNSLNFSRDDFGKVPSLELNILVNRLSEMAAGLRDAQKKELQFESERVFSQVAKQVAHDIRSPLSALNMIVASYSGMPEEERRILKNASQRINDIANDLLGKAKKEAPFVVSAPVRHYNLAPVQLSTIVDAVVSEKRVQLRDKMQIKIEAQLLQSFDAFACVQPLELARIVSNLVNNSVEAMRRDQCEIFVSVGADGATSFISVIDNGCGIPLEVLSKLGKAGVTFGKEGTSSGNGLGIYHAKKTVESWGGKLNIQSHVGEGTRIDILLPKAEPPSWFQKQTEIMGTKGL